MKLIQVLVTTAIILVILQAETPLKLMMLRITKSCPGCRLVGVELKNVDLEGANLRNADLRWAKFRSVNLNYADLSGANLRHAHLEDVTLKDTDLCGAVLMNSAKGYCYSVQGY